MKAICPKCGQPGLQTIHSTPSGRYMVFNHGNKIYKHRITGRKYSAPSSRCFIGRSYTTDEAMNMMGLGGERTANDSRRTPKTRYNGTRRAIPNNFDKLCRRCGVRLALGDNYTEHQWRIYDYICTKCKAERFGKRKYDPQYARCPRCGDMGRLNPYVDKGQRIVQFIHEKIPGSWGRTNYPKRRRCYVTRTPEVDFTTQPLLQQQL